MIFIDRLSLEAPRILSGASALIRKRAAISFFKGTNAQRRQKRFNFDLEFARQEVGLALQELFHGKCAYCEQTIDTDIERHRPTTNSLGADGRTSPDHYWWLAFNWDNLYPVCNGCSRAKANRFPVKGNRAPIYGDTSRLSEEKALLLDPCKDRPEEHISFDIRGRAIALTERGYATIEILALNRKQLLELRREESDRVIQAFNDSSGNEAMVNRLTSDDMPFAATRRALFGPPSGESGLREHLREQERQNQESARYRVGPTATAQDRAIERSRTRYIERVTLKNIGIHGNLDLRTAKPETSNAPWLMLLGENGVGKSTLLKAIVFALSTPAQRWDLREYTSSIEPRDEKIGSIAIHYTDGEIVRVTIDPAARHVEANFVEPRFRLLALGATRLPPTSKRRPPREPSFAKVMNLFDPFCPLADSVDWLSTISSREFERAGAALKALLGLAAVAMFERRKNQVALRQGTHTQDLRVLSDGYQTIIGVACAIMSTLVPPDQPVETAEGIVLIDEIGNHLHPTWRMRIVHGLKAAFPRVQFIATTHEPLCLRGLEDGEIAVLRRNTSHRSSLIDDLPSVKGLLVDQILSSAHFGLGSTIDPMTADKFDRYYALLAKSRPNGAEKVELAWLRDELDRIRLIGNTPSEQILLRVIDERVARATASGTPLDPGNLPLDLKNELVKLLEQATAKGPSKKEASR